MKPSDDTLEVIIAWGSMAVGLIACLVVGWLLLREVRQGKLGRFGATLVQGGATLFLGMVPLSVAFVVKWLASLGGVVLFSRDGANDGLLVGLGIMGITVAIGVSALFAAVMLFQALTSSGSSDV